MASRIQPYGLAGVAGCPDGLDPVAVNQPKRYLRKRILSRVWKVSPPLCWLYGQTPICLAPAQWLKAAKTVEGGQIWSISPTENNAWQRARAAKFIPSK